MSGGTIIQNSDSDYSLQLCGVLNTTVVASPSLMRGTRPSREFFHWTDTALKHIIAHQNKKVSRRTTKYSCVPESIYEQQKYLMFRKKDTLDPHQGGYRVTKLAISFKCKFYNLFQKIVVESEPLTDSITLTQICYQIYK